MLLFLSLLLAAPASAALPTPAEVHAKITKPWHGPLLDLKAALKPDRNYVAWVLVPPHAPMDMRSGNKFRHFYLATPPDDFTISHNMVVWSCKRRDGSHSEGGIAITGENDDQSQTMLKTGLGLTALFSNFTDGELQGTDDVVEEINDEAEEHGHATVAFEVSEDSCESMLQLVDAFSLDPRKPWRNFSNLKSPERLEGGGCVTLAGALLQRAGVLTNVFPHVWRQFGVNRKLLGGNLPLPPHVQAPTWPWLEGRSHHVPRLEVVASNWDGNSVTGSQPLRLMDPELMLYSLRTLSLEYLRTVPAGARAREEGVYERSSFGPRVIKSAVGPFLNLKKGYIPTHRLIPIDDNLDPQTALVARETRAWLEQAEHEGLRARHVKVRKSPGIILDRP